MFADVMVRVIGVSYFTSVPSTVSDPEDSNPSGGVCSCSPARNTTVTPEILVFPSSVPNHAAIYCGDGELLHHIPEQLSKRERYTDKWQRRTHSLWRHRAWRASAFTGIYNDLAAASTFV
ncbi:C40 family peptidase [Escherichia coli]|nr:C40 family peptidase [Escherichia coli]